MASEGVPRPEPTTDVSPARWLEEEIGEFASGVRALIPPRFEAYARILHPAGSADGGDVSWQEVAAWSGRRMHALAQFEAISRPAAGSGSGPRPFEYDPLDGEPDPELLEALCEILAGHTTTPERCWFCLWEGWGWIDDGGVIITSGPQTGDSFDLPPAFPDAVLKGPRVRLSGRDYILLAGELAGALQIGDRYPERIHERYPEVDPSTFDPQPPSVFWPDDRAWCVASELDLVSTYVGGTAALIDGILADPRLEAWRVYPDDPIDESSDRINDPR
ncbi:MAG TPA: hypothetical protein VK919_14475 [Solirubrobacterales bacterium]|nr:hypothetical protein [Solirubrobacterales bacterium]